MIDPIHVIDQAVERLKGRERAILIGTAVAHVLILVAMIVLRLVPLLTGDTILVRVVPVDPRDLFRGDYVTLSYEFSRIPSGGIDGLDQTVYDPAAWRGRPVYVALGPDVDGRHWRAERVSVNRPTSGTYVRGRVADFGQLIFGIEAYYVQEGGGLEYEEAARDRRLSAEIAVTRRGQAALRALRIE